MIGGGHSIKFPAEPKLDLFLPPPHFGGLAPTWLQHMLFVEWKALVTAFRAKCLEGTESERNLAS